MWASFPMEHQLIAIKVQKKQKSWPGLSIGLIELSKNWEFRDHWGCVYMKPLSLGGDLETSSLEIRVKAK